MPSRFTHAVAKARFNFLWLSNIPLYVYVHTHTHTYTYTHTSFFILSFIDEHSWCFHILAIINNTSMYIGVHAAAKSLQSCLTLCDPIDGSPPGSAVPGILQARTLEWVAISFSNRGAYIFSN